MKQLKNTTFPASLRWLSIVFAWIIIIMGIPIIPAISILLVKMIYDTMFIGNFPAVVAVISGMIVGIAYLAVLTRTSFFGLDTIKEIK